MYVRGGEKGSCQLYKDALAGYPDMTRSHPCITPRGQSRLNHTYIRNEQSLLFSESVREAKVIQGRHVLWADGWRCGVV